METNRSTRYNISRFFSFVALTFIACPAFADVDTVNWTTTAPANPAAGTITSGANTIGVSLAYGTDYPNAGQLFTADWTLIAKNIGTVQANQGISIGYNTTGRDQTVQFDQPVNNPYLMFSYTDPETVDFSSAGASNVVLINSTISSTAFSNGVVTTVGNNSTNSGFVVQLLGTYTQITFNVKLNRSGGTDSNGFTVAADGVNSTIAGTVVGLLAGNSVALQLNGSADPNYNVTANANGVFIFPATLTAGQTYAVTVATQPTGQTCVVTNGAGLIAGNVTNVLVTCTPPYTVSGTLMGLDTGNTVGLQLNGGVGADYNLAPIGNGVFTFPATLNAAQSYIVTVGVQPAGQICTVTNGTGTIVASNVTDVQVTCVSVGGAGSGVGSIPTLSEYGLLILSGLLMILGLPYLRYRQVGRH